MNQRLLFVSVYRQVLRRFWPLLTSILLGGALLTLEFSSASTQLLSRADPMLLAFGIDQTLLEQYMTDQDIAYDDSVAQMMDRAGEVTSRLSVLSPEQQADFVRWQAWRLSVVLLPWLVLYSALIIITVTWIKAVQLLLILHTDISALQAGLQAIRRIPALLVIWLWILLRTGVVVLLLPVFFNLPGLLPICLVVAGIGLVAYLPLTIYAPVYLLQQSCSIRTAIRQAADLGRMHWSGVIQTLLLIIAGAAVMQLAALPIVRMLPADTTLLAAYSIRFAISAVALAYLVAVQQQLTAKNT